MDWPVTYQRKIRYSDTDAQGIAFNGNYLRYYDDTITDLFDAVDMDERALHAMGCEVLTVHAEVDFKATIRLGETLVVGVRVGRVGSTSITFELQSWETTTERITSVGSVVFVCVDPTDNTPVPVPNDLIAAFQSIHRKRLR